MRRLTFKGFLAKYAKGLSYSDMALDDVGSSLDFDFPPFLALQSGLVVRFTKEPAYLVAGAAILAFKFYYPPER